MKKHLSEPILDQHQLNHLQQESTQLTLLTLALAAVSFLSGSAAIFALGGAAAFTASLVATGTGPWKWNESHQGFVGK